MPPAIKVHRVYEKPAPEDGARVLVDRIWPRGLTKARAALDQWCKEIARSTELRKWYGHDPERFEEFAAGGSSPSAPGELRCPPDAPAWATYLDGK